MARIVESVGARIYVATEYGEPAVSAIKQLGGHWDPARKMWWVGKAKKAKLEEALVGSDRAQDEAADRGEAPPKERPEDIKLVGKCRYKGRTYYARFMGVTKRGRAARLISLDGAVDFWAPLPEPGQRPTPDQAEVIKEYQPREVWDGRRYSHATVKRYTTLASIQDFVAQQKDSSTRRGECTECGAWGPAGESCSECGGEGSYA